MPITPFAAVLLGLRLEGRAAWRAPTRAHVVTVCLCSNDLRRLHLGDLQRPRQAARPRDGRRAQAGHAGVPGQGLPARRGELRLRDRSPLPHTGWRPVCFCSILFVEPIPHQPCSWYCILHKVPSCLWHVGTNKSPSLAPTFPVLAKLPFLGCRPRTCRDTVLWVGPLCRGKRSASVSSTTGRSCPATRSTSLSCCGRSSRRPCRHSRASSWSRRAGERRAPALATLFLCVAWVCGADACVDT